MKNTKAITNTSKFTASIDDKTVKYFIDKDSVNRVHLSYGNSKMGRIAYFALLSGYGYLQRKDGLIFCNEPGTCDGCSENKCADNGCYAVRDELRHNNTTIVPHAENTIMIRRNPTLFFQLIALECMNNNVQILRANESGEFPTLEAFRAFVDFASKNEWLTIYTYTKRFEWLETVYREYNYSFPENLHINVSIYIDRNGVRNYDNPYGFSEFIWNDCDSIDLSKLPHCPAVLPDGSHRMIVKKDNDGNAIIDKDGNPVMVPYTCDKCLACVHAKFGSCRVVYKH